MSDVSDVNVQARGTRVQRIVTRDGSVAYTVLALTDYQPVEPIHDWLRLLKKGGNKTSDTLRSYATAMHLFWDWRAASGIDWRTLTLEQLASYAHWLEFPAAVLGPGIVDITPVERAREEDTVRDYLGPVYRFYEHHVRKGLPAPFPLWQTPHGYKTDIIGMGHATAMRPVTRSGKKRIPKTLTLDQCREVVDAQRCWRDKLLFTLLATTGIRVGSALGLRHEDFRPWDNELRLVRRVNANDASVKRSTSSRQREPSPKLLTRPAINMHSEYMYEEYGDVESDYLFVNLWSGDIGHPLNYAAVDKIVKATRKRVGFHFTPHMFRHTFATMHLEAGVPVDRVAVMLDHASGLTTSDIYGHVSATAIRKQMEEAGLITGPLSTIGAP